MSTTATSTNGTYPILEAARAIVRYLTPTEKQLLRDELTAELSPPEVHAATQALLRRLSELGPWEGDIEEARKIVEATRSPVGL